MLSGGTSARVPGQSKTYRDSRNSGHKMELHSGGNRRWRRNIGERLRDGTQAHSAACKGAVYLPDLSGTRKEHMGERAVHHPLSHRGEGGNGRDSCGPAVGSATLAPHTVTLVRVINPTPRARGTVMIETGPGPLGLCPVRGVVEVKQDSSIWLANT